MLLDQKQTYAFTSENFNYLFKMDKKEQMAFRLKDKIDKNLVKIDFTDLNNQRVYKSITFCVSILMMAQPVFATGTGVAWIDNIGNFFLRYARAAGYWVCIVRAIMVIVEAVSKDELGKCWKKVVGYGIAFASLYWIPEIFDSIRRG